MANYLNFSTFEEANRSAANFTEVVPSQFTLPDPRSPGEEWLIKSKFSDNNERHGSGNSVTLAPTGYNFNFNGNVLRIIDTPVIGDTGGSGEDRKNFDQILLYLQQHKDLHGLIIIVKGNDNRKTLFFKYCITELLTHLHRSVVQNIVFCFTNSQVAPGSIGPGEGYKVMKSFLEEDISSVGIKLKPGRNAFFIENDAYRFLVAKNQGYPWSEIQEFLYKHSWNHSVAEIERMFSHISSLTPHRLDATISLNNARKIVIELSEPIVLLSQEIEKNLDEIKKAQQLLEHGANTRENLAAFLETTITDLVKKPNQVPQLVCKADCCIERIYVEGEGEKINYKTVCHRPCFCLIWTDIIGKCWATNEF